jgi:hypothetical protein
MRMKWFGWSWLGLLAVGVGLAPALADDPADRPIPPRPPQVLSPGAPIPANGGILIESSDGSTVVAVVTDPTGALVEGTTRLVSKQEAAFFAWRPAGELGLGAHWIDLRNESGSSLNSAFEVEIVAATARAKPELAVSPSISTVVTPSAHACCLTSNQAFTDHCALSQQQTLAQLDPALASTETISALNQFLFRVRVAEGTPAPQVAKAFLPFGSNAALYFEAAADEYCIEIDAIDIVTLEEHSYPDLDHCVARSNVAVGTMPIALDGEFFADERCVFPPPGHEEQWCEVHGDDCDDDKTVQCTLFRYACEGEDEPVPDAGNETDAGVVRAPETSSSDGCSVSAPGARGHSGSLLFLVLFVLLVRARPA